MSKLIFQRTDKNKNYTITDNHYKYDSRISAKAKGVFDVILSLPDDWDLNIKHLTGFFSDGITSIRSAINELKDFGYLEYHRCQDEQGKLTQHAYVVNEKPEGCPDICFKNSGNSKTKSTNKNVVEPLDTSNPINFNALPDSAFIENQCQGDSCIENQYMGKPTLPITNITKTNQNKTKHTNKLKPPAVVVSHSKQDNLFDVPVKQKKVKKKGKADLVSYIYTVTDNEELQTVLTEYFRMRVKRGLNFGQWKLILSDLFEYTATDTERIRKVESAIAGGFNLLVPDWEKNRPAKKYQSRGFVDNLAGKGNKETSGMTDDERRALIASRSSGLEF